MAQICCLRQTGVLPVTGFTVQPSVKTIAWALVWLGAALTRWAHVPKIFTCPQGNSYQLIQHHHWSPLKNAMLKTTWIHAHTCMNMSTHSHLSIGAAGLVSPTVVPKFRASHPSWGWTPYKFGIAHYWSYHTYTRRGSLTPWGSQTGPSLLWGLLTPSAFTPHDCC